MNVEVRFGLANSSMSWPSDCSGLVTSVYVDGVKQNVTFSRVPFSAYIIEGVVSANSGQVVSASLFDTRSHNNSEIDKTVTVGMRIQNGGWADPNDPVNEGVYASGHRWAHKSVKLT